MASNAYSQTLSANGSTTPFYHAGGDAWFGANGTFGSGTLIVYASYDSGTSYQSLGSDATLTAEGSFKMNLPSCYLKATLTGSTSPSIVCQFTNRVV